MVIQHTPHHLHFEIDFDTGKLLQLVLISFGVLVMFSLLFAQPAKIFDSNDISVQPAQAKATQSIMPMGIEASKKTVPLFSAQIEAGITTSDTDQPYFIPSPE
jgi:hypothetical protein